MWIQMLQPSNYFLLQMFWGFACHWFMIGASSYKTILFCWYQKSVKNSKHGWDTAIANTHATALLFIIKVILLWETHDVAFAPKIFIIAILVGHQFNKINISDQMENIECFNSFQLTFHLLNGLHLPTRGKNVGISTWDVDLFCMMTPALKQQ